MRRTLVASLLIGATVLIVSCSFDKSPLEPSIVMDGQDIIKREIVSGVFLSLENFQNEYTRIENVSGTLRIKNKSNADGFRIHIGSYPPYGEFSIFNSDEDKVWFYTPVRGQMEFDSTLQIGDELVLDMNWNQTVSNVPDTDLEGKVEIGEYKVKARFYGNPELQNKRVTKTIRIINNESSSIAGVWAWQRSELFNWAGKQSWTPQDVGYSEDWHFSKDGIVKIYRNGKVQKEARYKIVNSENSAGWLYFDEKMGTVIVKSNELVVSKAYVDGPTLYFARK